LTPVTHARIPIGLMAFDLDDTLYPERQYISSGFRAVASAHADLFGDPAYAANRLHVIFDSGNRNRTFNELVVQCDPHDSNETIRAMVTTFREHQPTIQLYKDAEPALDFWCGRTKTALISDGYKSAQQKKIAALNLESRFDWIVLTDEWGAEYWKPHPRAFEHAQKQCAAKPEHCAYVSDNPAKDFVAPNHLGWHTVQIIRPRRIYPDATPPDGGTPHHLIHDLGELKDLFDPIR